MTACCWMTRSGDDGFLTRQTPGVKTFWVTGPKRANTNGCELFHGNLPQDGSLRYSRGANEEGLLALEARVFGHSSFLSNFVLFALSPGWSWIDGYV